jgi:hypothetical protein
MYMKKIWKKCFRQKKSIILIIIINDNTIVVIFRLSIEEAGLDIASE